MTRSCMEHVKDFFHPYLLPLKAISFLLVGAPASIVPYIPIFNRNLGLNAAENGIIFGALPFLSILSRPTAGTLLDKLRAHRVILRVFLLTELLFYFVDIFHSGFATNRRHHRDKQRSHHQQLRLEKTWLNVTRDELNGVPGFITNNSAEVVDTFTFSRLNRKHEQGNQREKRQSLRSMAFAVLADGFLLVIGWFGYGAANTSLDVIALHIVDASR
ncbi:hypothetical protein BV898_10465 [Hypsibius exemplaris]|uniref:Major facilitator superfamily associated domain-containing protein n=1 Tax=Hypsibius exemplaris TaxID=2072580 RepID=A0A1W0WJK6_HYPEX|nr:hypothetical protein BV898_10465 [Hypsibius exemplaris]